jgi:hypothetical protein
MKIGTSSLKLRTTTKTTQLLQPPAGKTNTKKARYAAKAATLLQTPPINSSFFPFLYARPSLFSFSFLFLFSSFFLLLPHATFPYPSSLSFLPFLFLYFWLIRRPLPIYPRNTNRERDELRETQREREPESVEYGFLVVGGAVLELWWLGHHRGVETAIRAMDTDLF